MKYTEDDMDYEGTIELEKNIIVKNSANQIYADFNAYVTFSAKNYEGDGIFKQWSDSHNATFFVMRKDHIVFQCRFLHEKYDLIISPSTLFEYIKKDYRGLHHLYQVIAAAKVEAKRKERHNEM